VNGPARDGDVYRFDRYSKDPYGRDQEQHFCMDARDDAAAMDEAEYLLNPENSAQARDMTGKLWRVDSGSDVLIADVGPLDFGGGS
jgi:hypothetical protein